MMTHPAPTVRVCHVGAVIVLVSLDRGADGTWRARHSPTGAFGFGATEADALAMVGEHLECDRAWYLGTGRRRAADGDRGADSDGLRAHGRDGMTDQGLVPGAIVVIHNPFYPQDTNGVVMAAPTDHSWATVLLIDGENAGTYRAFSATELEVVGHVPRYTSERRDAWNRGKRIAWRSGA